MPPCRALRTTRAGHGRAGRSHRRSTPPTAAPGARLPRSSSAACRTCPLPNDRRCRARNTARSPSARGRSMSRPAADPAPHLPRSRSGRRSRAPPRRAPPRAPARWRGSHRARQRATRRHAGKPPRAPSPRRGRRPPTACNLCARARTTAGHGSSALHCRCGLFEPVVAPEELVADRDGRDAAHAALVCLACRLP